MSNLKLNLRSGVASLAHFSGIGKGPAPKAAKRRVEPFAGIGGTRPKAKGGKDDQPPAPENDPPPPDDDDDEQALADDDYGADAPNDNDTPDEAEAKRMRRVERKARREAAEGSDLGDGNDPDNGGDEQDPDDETCPDDGDDPDEEMKGSSPVAKARRRERARCARILGHKAAALNPDLAGHFAFNTNMSRGSAISALKAGTKANGPAATGSMLGRAMAGYAAQRPGTPPAGQKPKALVTQEAVDDVFTRVTAYRRK
jgi:hypothetical protein